MNAQPAVARKPRTALLVTVSGRDRPGVTTRFVSLLAAHRADIVDMEQVVIRGRLILGILCRPHPRDDVEQLDLALRRIAADIGVRCDTDQVPAQRPRSREDAGRHHVTMLGQPLPPAAIAAVTEEIAALGCNIEHLERLSRYPLLSFELVISGMEDTRALQQRLGYVAAREHIDIAVERAGLHRRAKRLIVFDVDSTLITGEVIEMLAAHAGVEDEVRSVTEAAMRGELDFRESLQRRVAMLKGVPESAFESVRAELVLTPGARTVMRTLARLGYVVAVVSGGFHQIVDPLAAALGVRYAHANTLEVRDGLLTGEVIGEIIDREAKATKLREIAAAEGIAPEQTVAVGDGANDLDMLNAAGLGVAFNAKPMVREAADTALNVPYLDAVLFLLGIRREEIEQADAEDPDLDLPPPPPVAEYPTEP